MTDLSVSPVGSRSGYAAGRKRSGGALAAAIALNGGVFTLILALPATHYLVNPDKGLTTVFVPLEKDPPRNRPEPVRQQKHRPTQKPAETPKADPLPFVPPVQPFDTDNAIRGTAGPGQAATGTFVEPPPLPVHKPVFRAATRDPHFADAFHPNYPPALQRLGLEGSVTVRVTIDETGHVTAVELVKATDRAFFEETKEQALRHWRFLPATSDGMPVPSQQVLTVSFRLET